jgi:hypothetical protein
MYGRRKVVLNIIFKKAAIWVAVWALLGLAFGSCQGLTPKPNDVGIQSTRVEIHDAKGLLRGYPRVGETLTAVPVYPSARYPTKLTYQWVITTDTGSKAIPGATSVTYTSPSSDLAGKLSVLVDVEAN